MKVTVVEASDRKIKLLLEETTASFINAIRRTLVADVPKLAIEEVTVYDNKSALFDEIIAHRLGLLPIPTDLRAFNFREECPGCKGEGCPSCTVLYTLTFEGPGTVYARDLQPVDPKFAIAEPDVPIVRLGRDQRLMLEATAVMGRGSKNAKWQPVAAAGYREVPTVRIKGPVEMTPKQRKEFAELAPPGALDIKPDRIDVVDEVKAHDFLHNAGSRYGLANVEYGTKPGAFFFQFETDGSLTAKEAFQEALHILMGKLKDVEEAAAGLQ